MSSTNAVTGPGLAPPDDTGSDPVEGVELDIEDEPEPAGPLTRLVVAAVALAIGVAALVNSYESGIGTLTEPGAGLWPAYASAVLTGTAVILLAGVRRMNGCERLGRGTLTVGLGVASIAVFVVLFGGISAWPGVGFELAVAALLTFWLKVLGRESWRTTVLVTAACTVAAHLFLIELLSAPIPHLIGG